MEASRSTFCSVMKAWRRASSSYSSMAVRLMAPMRSAWPLSSSRAAVKSSLFAGGLFGSSPANLSATEAIQLAAALNGLQAMHSLLPRHASLPILMLSGTQDVLLMRVVLSHGASGFVTKTGNSAALSNRAEIGTTRYPRSANGWRRKASARAKPW